MVMPFINVIVFVNAVDEVADKSDDPGTRGHPVITVNLTSGNEVVASISCNTDELKSGQAQIANCISDGNPSKRYDSIEVENTF